MLVRRRHGHILQVFHDYGVIKLSLLVTLHSDATGL